MKFKGVIRKGNDSTSDSAVIEVIKKFESLDVEIILLEGPENKLIFELIKQAVNESDFLYIVNKNRLLDSNAEFLVGFATAGGLEVYISNPLLEKQAPILVTPKGILVTPKVGYSPEGVKEDLMQVMLNKSPINTFVDKMLEDIAEETLNLLKEGEKQAAYKYLMSWLDVFMRSGTVNQFTKPKGIGKTTFGITISERLRGKVKDDEKSREELEALLRDIRVDVKLIGKVGIPFKGDHDNSYFRTKNK